MPSHPTLHEALARYGYSSEPSLAKNKPGCLITGPDGEDLGAMTGHDAWRMLRSRHHHGGCCVNFFGGYPRACDASTCMNLSEGETCATCVHTSRCVAIFGAKPENTSCDFFPRRFRRREATP